MTRRCKSLFRVYANSLIDDWNFLIGFAIHPTKKWQAARAALVSVFAFVAILVMVFTDERAPADVLVQSPAMGLAAVLFLFFSIFLTAQLQHILSTRFVLEFNDDSIIDRRRRRPVVIPYSQIEIFSPELEFLFNTEPTSAEYRSGLGIDDFISFSCRLRSGHSAGETSDDFVFFEKIEIPSYEMQQKITLRLKQKIARFEHLVQDDGSGFGDDETNA